MTEEKKSFWTRLFGGYRSSVREQKVLEYIVYRMNQGANLRDVVRRSTCATAPPGVR